MPEFEPGQGSDVVLQDYDLDGTIQTPEEKAVIAAAWASRVDMQPVSPTDAPFSETLVPGGWSRVPTAAEVAILNAKYPVAAPVPDPVP